MRFLSSLFLTTLAGFGVAPAATGQCQFQGVVVASIGQGCNVGSVGCCAVVPQPTRLSVGLDVATCSVELGVETLEGCCGVTVLTRLVVIGTAPTSAPLPGFGPSCTLHVQPVAVLAGVAPTFSVPIPPSLTALSFLVQSVAIQLDPFGTTPRFTLSDAHSVTLQ
jgi:hypothetical protein